MPVDDFPKRQSFDGVDLAFFDFLQVHHSPILVTKVTKQMWVKNLKTYIGIKENMMTGEVIRIGKLQLSYKVMKVLPKEKNGNVYMIRRVDDNATTQLDIDNAKKDSKVKRMSLRTFKDQFETRLGI